VSVIGFLGMASIEFHVNGTLIDDGVAPTGQTCCLGVHFYLQAAGVGIDPVVGCGSCRLGFHPEFLPQCQLYIK